MTRIYYRACQFLTPLTFREDGSFYFKVIVVIYAKGYFILTDENYPREMSVFIHETANVK